MLKVRLARAIAKFISAEVAAKYVASVAIDAVIRQVPTETNETAPEVKLTVQTPVVELV